ncbi:YeeE/YedE family protein [Maritimibacter sp. DP1N21-5]|uniref:YeeE/YedE family protein n=1 Tax=Maritimibacter sp. DP1N21-5 TaxID=2836867 RepID=UPI001C46DA01|nr:YeeE/YedE family protein [Maritimibacter sp. DP1N21-5]MBV7409586.1 YeeE/YedE family protein [Maritimibacter sp. DP1N21-5]
MSDFIDMIGAAEVAAIVGLLGGVLLGLSARLGRFCTLGAIEDALYAESSVRLRMWGIAIGVAMIGNFGLLAMGAFDMDQAVYFQVGWMPLASIAGGLIFGYGMAMAGNCGFGALARLGGGDLRNFVIVLVMGLAAYVTISGPLAFLRVWIFPERALDPGETPPGIAQWIEAATGLPASVVGIGLGVVIIAAMFSAAEMRADRSKALWAAVAGLAVVIGWGGTAWVAANGFDPIPVESHTFSAPLGDTILWLMTASGTSVNFGVGSVVGVLTGAFIGSLIKGHFRWEACEDPRELKRQIGGASLMGIGAVVAFGCSIGQGLSAMSLLYAGAPLTLAAIVAGAALGLRHLISGFAPAE